MSNRLYIGLVDGGNALNIGHDTTDSPSAILAIATAGAPVETGTSNIDSPPTILAIATAGSPAETDGSVIAWAELLSPLGDLKVLAGPVVRRALVALPSPLGVLAAVGDVPRAAWLALPSPLGALRVWAQSFVDAWGSAGFPLPRIQGYSYQRDAGLIRTKMLSGANIQRRKWTDAYRQASVSFEIPTSLLYEMEAFIDEQGYDWFGMKLVTGDNYDLNAEIHQVRVISDPSYGDVYGENIVVTLSLEVLDPATVKPKAFNPRSDYAILFIDEAHQSYTTFDPDTHEATNRYISDLAIFEELPPELSERVLVLNLRNELWENTGKWELYPTIPVDDPPIQNIVACPRIGTGGRPDLEVAGEGLTGQWIYDAVVETFGLPTTGFRRAYVFVDTSGSMDRDNLGTALDDFYVLAGETYVCRELLCQSERWLRWIYNVNTNLTECV